MGAYVRCGCLGYCEAVVGWYAEVGTQCDRLREEESVVDCA